jgi:hypothetical protein
LLGRGKPNAQSVVSCIFFLIWQQLCHCLSVGPLFAKSFAKVSRRLKAKDSGKKTKC